MILLRNQIPLINSIERDLQHNVLVTLSHLFPASSEHTNKKIYTYRFSDNYFTEPFQSFFFYRHSFRHSFTHNNDFVKETFKQSKQRLA